MLYEQKFLFSLVLTLIVEIPIVVFLVKYLYKHEEIKIYKVVLIGFVASALTMPYFWFVLPAYISDRGVYIFSGEFVIICVEAIIYNQLLKLKLSEAFTVSFIANIASVFLGLVF